MIYFVNIFRLSIPERGSLVYQHLDINLNITLTDLKKIRIFEDCGKEVLQPLLDISIQRRLEKDEFFFHKDDPAKYAYALINGRIKISQVSQDGQNIIIRLVTPGEFFGLVAIMPEKKYPISAQAAEDSFVLAWPGNELNKIFETQPSMLTQAMNIMSENFQELQNKYRHLATERVECRLARSLIGLARQIGRKTGEGVLIDLLISQKDLAQMSGTTIYSVNRILKAWEEGNLIEIKREHIIIRKLHGLVKISEGLE